MFEVINAIALLLTAGDYTAPLNLIGLPEDSPIIDVVLSALGH